MHRFRQPKQIRRIADLDVLNLFHHAHYLLLRVPGDFGVAEADAVAVVDAGTA